MLVCVRSCAWRLQNATITYIYHPAPPCTSALALKSWIIDSMGLTNMMSTRPERSVGLRP